MELAEAIYRVTRAFPREEIYGLTSQIRRAAVSVPSNIAEGHARRSTREFLHFIAIALGSVAELQTQLLLATRIGILSHERFDELDGLSRECQSMLNATQITLRSRVQQGTTRGSQGAGDSEG